MRLTRRPGGLVAGAALLLTGACALGAPAKAVSYPTVAAAGDVACSPKSPDFGAHVAGKCGESRTAALVAHLRPRALLVLGDSQYPAGTPRAFRISYQPTWGAFLAITHPAVGNHEYGTPGAMGYFRYFGTAAGVAGQGWYSYDVGTWHLVSLNGECAQVGGCGAGSVQERWLAADLAAHRAQCTLAYWHQPRFSSGMHGNNADYAAFWDDLSAAGADVVLNGHDHDYERFAPQSPAGVADPARGIREFVVGTGGEDQRPFHAVQPNSQVRITGSFGVLALTLAPDHYTWSFVQAGTQRVLDAGTTACH